MPDLGGIDLSPIILLLGIFFLQQVIIRYPLSDRLLIMTGAPSPARPAWREREDGISLDLRVTPGARQAAIRGVQDIGDGREALAVTVREKARDGEANRAVIALIAGALGIAPARISLMTGSNARLKSLHLEGESAKARAIPCNPARRARAPCPQCIISRIIVMSATIIDGKAVAADLRSPPCRRG